MCVFKYLIILKRFLNETKPNNLQNFCKDAFFQTATNEVYAAENTKEERERKQSGGGETNRQIDSFLFTRVTDKHEGFFYFQPSPKQVNYSSQNRQTDRQRERERERERERQTDRHRDRDTDRQRQR